MNEAILDSQVSNTFSQQSYTNLGVSFGHSKISGMNVMCQMVAVEHDNTYQAMDSKTPKKKKVAELIVIPDCDVRDLSANPIIQSSEGAGIEHPSLAQPRYVDFITVSKTFDRTEHQCADSFITALKRMDAHLKQPVLRQKFECSSLDAVTIENHHISFMPETEQKVNSTLGIRGVVALKDLPVGTPLVYSSQYLREDQWGQSISQLAKYLEEKLDLTNEVALHDAKRRLESYAPRPTFFSSQTFYTPAYGAGNITGLINHDAKYYNMSPAYTPLFDIKGKPTAGIWFFHSTRHIKKGEQLLVNYGSNYNYEPFESKLIWEDTSCL